MATMNLFDNSSYDIKPVSGKSEPAIWIRRLQIVESLKPEARLIRDIEFRRGLNIICTEYASSQDRRVVGHSVGKTLLMRLIRYCLGEQSFCTKQVRAAIASKLEHAYVLAEIHVLGKPWVVARPIGLDTGKIFSWAVEGNDLSLLFKGSDTAVKYSEFVAALEQATAAPFADVLLPHLERPATWLDLLAWLSRDQECRFRHQSQWRDPESESRTAQLQMEDASMIVRMVMDLLPDEEKRLQKNHRKQLASRRELQSTTDKLAQEIENEANNLCAVLKLDKDIHQGPLFAAAAKLSAVEKQKQLQRLLDDQNASPVRSNAKDKWLDLFRAVDRIEQTKFRKQEELVLEEAHLHQLEEADNDSYYENFGEIGEKWCRLFQTQDEATRHGCPGAPKDSLKPGERSPRQIDDINEAKKRVDSLKNICAELEADLKSNTDERDAALKIYNASNDAYIKATEDINRKIGAWGEIVQRSEAYEKNWELLEKNRTGLLNLERKIVESSEMQRLARASLESKRKLLSSHFDQVLKKLIGPEAGGEIEIDSRSITPRPNSAVAASGQALSTSATVLGFDFACQIAYITGLGFLPGIFLHDSPREADMEDALYHRLFDLAFQLESVFGRVEPSFQYIVATTTPPPATLNQEPYVRLRLDARLDDGLLLRQRLRLS